MKTPFQEALGKALLKLYVADKYLYNVAARLIIQEGATLEDMPEVRGYTNGVRIFLTPAWLKADPELQWTTVTHEVLHIVSKHLIRTKNVKCNQRRMNVAADLSIASQQIELGQNPAIRDAVPNWTNYLDMDMFEIYELLEDEDGDLDLGHPEFTPSEGGAEGEDGDQPSNGQDPGEVNLPSKEEEFEVDQAIQQAAMQADAEGYSTKASRAASRLVSDMRAKPIRWDKYLKQVVSRMKSDIPTWKRPNRRMMSQIMLPSRTKKEVFEATVAMDVSGSVGEVPLNQMVAIVQDLLTRYVSTLHLMSFDDKIVDEWDLTRKDKGIKLELNGYGGTYVQVVIDHLKELKRVPKLLVIATDGYIPATEDPGYPVIWLIVDNPGFTSSYGTVLHVNTGEL